MNYDGNTSPVDWYLATYQLRFIELAQPNNDDLNRRFLTWDNTILVKAASMGEAYAKAVELGMANTHPYHGGPAGVEVQWVFEGIVELLPIYEELKDGAEIAWSESTKSLKTIRRRVISQEEAHQNSQYGD